MFGIFGRRRKSAEPQIELDISPDPSRDVKASEAVKRLLAMDGELTNGLDILRTQIFHRLLNDMFDGDERTAIMLLSLWANVGDRAMSSKASAELTGFSEQGATHSMNALYALGAMERGQAPDGVTYYRLSQRGLNLGRHSARRCIEIVEAVR